MSGTGFSWDREHRIGAAYAAIRLGHRATPADPDEFGVVWANMVRGVHLGDLRELPPLDHAFRDWLREARALSDEHIPTGAVVWPRPS
ncbi:hypothetical protein SUDANB95_02650 [Actinosynnema sp. ALI-1.44]